MEKSLSNTGNLSLNSMYTRLQSKQWLLKTLEPVRRTTTLPPVKGVDIRRNRRSWDLVGHNPSRFPVSLELGFVSNQNTGPSVRVEGNPDKSTLLSVLLERRVKSPFSLSCKDISMFRSLCSFRILSFLHLLNLVKTREYRFLQSQPS